MLIEVKNEPENNRFADVDLHNRWSGIGSFPSAVDFGLNILEIRDKVI